MHKWTKVATFRGDKGERGHRIFKCAATGGFAIADNSGELPEQTEDGVLWMEPRVTVGKNSVTFNLLDGYHTSDPTNEHNLRTLAELAARWPDSFRVEPAASDAFFGEMLIERVATRFGVTVIAVDDACSARGWSVLIFDRADSVQCERGGGK